MASEITLLSATSSTLESPRSKLLVSTYFPRCIQPARRERKPVRAVETTGVVGLATERVSAVPLVQRREARPSRVGCYTLEAKLGEGGMGVVYRAKHDRSPRPVAVKLQSIEDTHARFRREGAALRCISHPNIVSGLDCGTTADGTPYLVMESVDGLTLADLIQCDGAQPVARVIHILLQVAAGLSAAHRLGFVHCDIKPSNIMLCQKKGQDDLVKVIDFGLVRRVGSNAAGVGEEDPMVVGTPLYLAPESILNPSEIDHRADIYALGAVGYYLLTGAHVFCTSDTFKLCRHHLGTPPPRLAERGAGHCPPALERIILRCLAKLREDRFPDMRSLIEALKECAAQAPWTTTDARLWWEKYHGAAPTRRSPALCSPAPKHNPVSQALTVAHAAAAF